MPCLFNPFLNIDVTIAKSRFTFCLCGVEKGHQTWAVLSNTDSATPAPGDSFNPNRITDLLCELCGLVSGINRPFFIIFTPTTSAAGDKLQSGFCSGLPCFYFVPHSPNILNRGTDESYLVCLTNLGELCVLCEKTRPRMNSIDIRKICNGNNIGILEITLY